MSHKRAGYSLFEVLVAFAIMTMVLGVLLPRQAQMLGRTTQIEERLVAQDFAMSRMALLGVVKPYVVGSTSDSYREWTVVQEIEPTTLAGTEIEVLNVTVTIQNNRDVVLAIVETQVVNVEQP